MDIDWEDVRLCHLKKSDGRPAKLLFCFVLQFCYGDKTKTVSKKKKKECYTGYLSAHTSSVVNKAILQDVFPTSALSEQTFLDFFFF